MPYLFRFFSHRPLWLLHALGGALGWLVWFASPSYRATFRANVAQAGLSWRQARPAIAHTGRFVAELPKLWLRLPGQSCLANVHVAGQLHAQQAFAQGKGVIFFGPHCGSFELGPQVLAELYGPLTAIYRPARQAWLAEMLRTSRGRPGLELVPTSLSGIRQMLHALKRNQAVALLTDQVPPEGLGVWTPFFGKPAYTMTLAARLALQSGAVLLPVSCERLPWGRGYALEIRAPVQASVQDVLHVVTAMNQALEAVILSQPGQYLWGYARYKMPRQMI